MNTVHAKWHGVTVTASYKPSGIYMPLPVKYLRAATIKTFPSHSLFHISEEANKENTGLGNL